eukprot:304647-Pyramimonas_sp.AAC.1
MVLGLDLGRTFWEKLVRREYFPIDHPAAVDRDVFADGRAYERDLLAHLVCDGVLAENGDPSVGMPAGGLVQKLMQGLPVGFDHQGDRSLCDVEHGGAVG